jgi:hypothetical protein
MRNTIQDATLLAGVLLTVMVSAMAMAGLSDAAVGPDYSPPRGMMNPQVTQANISTTICMRGWTKTVRPLVGYTSALKRRQMHDRNLPGSPSDYEEDHWIPLEIAGHPRDPANLWPQPYANVGPAGAAHMKDKLENALNTAVCGGRWTLTQAQQCLLRQPTWFGCAQRLNVPTP